MGILNRLLGTARTTTATTARTGRGARGTVAPRTRRTGLGRRPVAPAPAAGGLGGVARRLLGGRRTGI